MTTFSVELAGAERKCLSIHTLLRSCPFVPFLVFPQHIRLQCEKSQDARSLLKSEPTRTNVAENTKQQKAGEKVDTKTLVVGQDVYIFCGSEFYGFAKGEVVKITSSGVEIKSAERCGPDSRRMEEIGIIRFDNNGVELEVDRRKRHGFEPGPGFSHDRFMQNIWYSAPECGPWQLDDMPFEERTAKIKHHTRLMGIMKTLVVGQEVWMVSGPYIKGQSYLKGKVVKVISPVEVLELPWRARKGGELRSFCLDGTQSDGSLHPEFGSWRLDDMPFGERTALIE